LVFLLSHEVPPCLNVMVHYTTSVQWKCRWISTNFKPRQKTKTRDPVYESWSFLPR